MKKILILLALVYSDCFGQSYNLYMENWTKLPYTDSIHGWWETLNKIENLNPIHSNSVATVFQDTSDVDGSFSARLVTKKFGTILLPGTLTTGVLDIQKQDLLPGKPFNQTITALTGFYKYQPVNGDSAMLYVHISKWNVALLRRDTLAVSKLIVKNTVSTWTSFTLNLEEKIAGQTPDSINILFVASADGEKGNGQVGSTLWIDHLTFFPTVSRDKFENQYGIQLFPNPGNNQLNIRTEKSLNQAVIKISDLTGKEVFSTQMSGFYTQVPLSINSGMYIVEVSENQKIIFTQKWVCQP